MEIKSVSSVFEGSGNTESQRLNEKLFILPELTLFPQFRDDSFEWTDNFM